MRATSLTTFALRLSLVAFVVVGCQAPSQPTSKEASGATSSVSSSSSKPLAKKSAKEAAPAAKKMLPGASAFKRARSTFRQESVEWTFHPTDHGYDVMQGSGANAAFRVVHKGRSFHLVPSGKSAPSLVLNWQPLGFSISRQELGGAFLNLRLTSSGWEIHRPGKVVVGTHRGAFMKLGDKAATARAASEGAVHAKIAGRPEVVHTGPLAAREVVLTLLPDLSLVEAATVALFFAEERWQ